MINDALDEGLLGGPCDIAKQVEGEACGVTAIPFVVVVVALLFLVSVFFGVFATVPYVGLPFLLFCFISLSASVLCFLVSFAQLLSLMVMTLMTIVDDCA